MAESVMPYVSVVAASAPGPVSAPVVTRTADELTERFLLRAQPRTPRHGWRRGVFAVTGGHVNPAAPNPTTEAPS